MKPINLAILCTVLGLVGCGDKDDADIAKNEPGVVNEQAKDAATSAADTAGQGATDSADAAKDASAAPAAGATNAAGTVADTTADAMQAGKEATAATAVEGTGDAAGTAAAPAADAAAGDLTLGQTIYEGKCQVCHATGAAGSPKLDDKANWAPRIAQGMDTLVKHALEGFKGSIGFMPPKGGFTTLSDDEVKAAVAYMVSKAQ